MTARRVEAMAGPTERGGDTMIISRTPFRISFFGGGTDYPVWFNEEKGAVLVTTIDKYCYITCRWLPPFFEHRHRIVYSRVETVRAIEEVEHPAVRAVLRYLGFQAGVELHHDGDLPARTGLGSSSSFTVGLLHSLYALKGRMADKDRLARDAIHVEQNLIQENVGSQDQTAAAFGGLNRVDFTPENHIAVQRLTLSRQRMQELQDHLMLYFTGFSRLASQVAGEQIRNTPNKRRELRTMYGMVDEAVGILASDTPLDDFGRLLHESWKLKRTLSSKVTSSAIDELYGRACRAGALGGKLLGAGGGGFFLIFAPPERQRAIKRALHGLLRVPFGFENLGSQIIFYQPNTYEFASS